MTLKSLIALAGWLIAGILLAACSAPLAEPTGDSAPPADTPVVETATDAATEAPVQPDYTIVSLLPRDAIPAIFAPQFLGPDEAGSEYDASELVIGVEINGDARAYSIPFLSGREIVNDTVGGQNIAVTW